MKTQINLHSPISNTFVSRVFVALALGLGWIACATPPSRADLVLGIADLTNNPGSSSNSFDATVTNTGPTAVGIAGFSFEITTTSSYVNFSDVTIYTQSAPYIFAGNSLFGPDITLYAAGNTVSAADNLVTPNTYVSLAPGETLGLGHVLFALASGAPQTPIPLTFSGYPATSFSLESVPEPTSLFMGLQGVSITCYIACRVRRRTSQ